MCFLFIKDDNQFTKEKRSQSNQGRSNKSGGTLRRVAFKDVPPCDSSSEDICTCSSNNSQQGYGNINNNISFKTMLHGLADITWQ